jgi:hypothetical protein
MIYFVVSVRDRAADVFGRPFYVPHRNVAVRDFTDEVNRSSGDNALFRHPDDFDLYLLGTFDDNTAKFEAEESYTCLVRGKDVVAKE